MLPLDLTKFEVSCHELSNMWVSSAAFYLSKIDLKKSSIFRENFMGKEEVKMVMEVLPKELGLMLHSFGILVEVVEESLALNLEVTLE